MRLACVVMVVAALLALLLGDATWAGDYHNTSEGPACSECHIMHASQAHGYAAETPVVPAAPIEYLLRQGNEACLTCHDGSSTDPDVYGTNTGTAYVREAGALNGAFGTYTPGAGYADNDGHTLAGSGGTVPPGGTTWTPDATDGLGCLDCHEGHAPDAQWRNLKLQPGDATANLNVTYASATLDLNKDVYQVDATLGQIATHYAIANVDFTEPTTTASAIGAWCGGCHGDFHGSSTDTNMKATGGEWVRHPTADANIGQNSNEHSSKTVWDGLTNHVKVMDPTGTWGSPSWDAGITPTCISCHKGHGNQNPFGLIFMSGSGTVTEEGDSGTAVTDLCGQCHDQGAT